MTDYEKCALSSYCSIGTLNETHSVELVQHKNSREVYVKKILSTYSKDVYLYMKSHHIAGTPRIIEAIEDDKKLIVIEEYISGQTIQSTLDDGNVFSSDEAIEIVFKLCQIVKRLHSLTPPLVHRDIKPSNILLSSDGNVTLIDMNASKFFCQNAQKDTNLLGTVGYAAPEQYGFGVSGIKSDIYAIGVVLNEMITGKAINEELAPGKLSKIIDKCTKIDPKDRYDSISNLIKDLKGAMQSTHKIKILNISKYALPGFRTGNTINKIVATFSYFAIIFLSLSIETENSSKTNLLLNKIFAFIFCMFPILFTCNYLNVWDILQISNIKNRGIKILAILGYDFLILIVLVTILLIVEKIYA